MSTTHQRQSTTWCTHKFQSFHHFDQQHSKTVKWQINYGPSFQKTSKSNKKVGSSSSLLHWKTTIQMWPIISCGDYTRPYIYTSCTRNGWVSIISLIYKYYDKNPNSCSFIPLKTHLNYHSAPWKHKNSQLSETQRTTFLSARVVCCSVSWCALMWQQKAGMRWSQHNGGKGTTLGLLLCSFPGSYKQRQQAEWKSAGTEAVSGLQQNERLIQLKMSF